MGEGTPQTGPGPAPTRRGRAGSLDGKLHAGAMEDEEFPAQPT